MNACLLYENTCLKCVITYTDFYASGEQSGLYTYKDCGLTFIQGIPAEAEIGRYYETPDYISHSDTKKDVMNAIYHHVCQYVLGGKARLVMKGSHRKSEKILDIGIGTGYFAHTIRNRGWGVEAVERSGQACNFTREHLGLDMRSEAALRELVPGTFDVVTSWHIMEYLGYLDEMWELLRELLTEEGVLIVAMPNCSSCDAMKYGRYWTAYDTPRHLWHFTPVTIQQPGSKHGSILAVRHPMPFDTFCVSILMEKHGGGAYFPVKGMWTGTAAWLSARVKKERSSSMIYVFRKKR